MFKYRRRPIVIPQSEHSRLAGTLALLWGNAHFDRPAIDAQSLVAGIALHDRGYGYLDNWAIGETSEPEWLRITRHGFYLGGTDGVADLIVKLHLKRLVTSRDSAERQALAQEMETAIQGRVARSGLNREEMARIDRITRLCDSIAFDFCMEEPAGRAVAVFARNDAREPSQLEYTIDDGEIQIDPWPLSLDTYANYLVGYRSEGYPEMLDPVIVPYRLARPGRQGG